jgi:hypothetical protein
MHKKNMCIIHNYSLTQIEFTCSLVFNEIQLIKKKDIICIKRNKNESSPKSLIVYHYLICKI